MAIYLGENRLSLAGTNGGYMLNGKLIATKTYSFNLGQTNFRSLNLTASAQGLQFPTTAYTTTASTTATFFKLGEAYDGTIINSNAYDYMAFFTGTIDFNYGSNNVNGTVHGIRYAYVRSYQYCWYSSTVNSSTGVWNNSVKNTTTQATDNEGIYLYQKADNKYATTTSNTYQPLYFSSPTVLSVDTNYLELKVSSFYTRYHATYAPEASLAALDPAQTTINLKWEVYQGDKSLGMHVRETAYELASNH